MCMCIAVWSVTHALLLWLCCLLCGSLSDMLQKKVEETLKSAALKADAMLQCQEDLFSVLCTLDAGIKYGDENDAHLTAEARSYMAQLHVFRSMCLYDLVCFLSAISIV